MVALIRNNYKKFIACFGVASVIMAVLRIFLIKSNIETLTFENTAQYRVNGSSGVTAFTAAVIALIVLFFIFSLFADKKLSFDTAPVYVSFVSAFTGFIIFSVSIYHLFKKIVYGADYKLFFTLFCVFMMLASVYFVFCAMSKKRGADQIKLMLSVLPSIAVMMILILTFIETTDFQSLSSTPYLITGLSLLLIYFINEGKFHMQKQMTKVYVFFGLASEMIIMIYCLPDIMLRLFWKLEINDYTIISLIGVIISAYIFSRLMSLKPAQDAGEETDDEKAEETAKEASETDDNENAGEQ